MHRGRSVMVINEVMKGNGRNYNGGREENNRRRRRETRTHTHNVKAKE